MGWCRRNGGLDATKREILTLERLETGWRLRKEVAVAKREEDKVVAMAASRRARHRHLTNRLMFACQPDSRL